MEKLRITKEYDKLDEQIVEQLKLVYPRGFSDHLITYTNKEGKNVSALRFETDEKIYLIRMTYQQAEDLIEADPDFDDSGSLIQDVKEEYEEKHADVDYLSENDNYNQ